MSSQQPIALHQILNKCLDQHVPGQCPSSLEFKRHISKLYYHLSHTLNPRAYHKSNHHSGSIDLHSTQSYSHDPNQQTFRNCILSYSTCLTYVFDTTQFTFIRNDRWLSEVRTNSPPPTSFSLYQQDENFTLACSGIVHLHLEIVKIIKPFQMHRLSDSFRQRDWQMGSLQTVLLYFGTARLEHLNLPTLSSVHLENTHKRVMPPPQRLIKNRQSRLFASYSHVASHKLHANYKTSQIRSLLKAPRFYMFENKSITTK